MAGVKTVNGISADTYERLALDSGAVYLNYGTPQQELIGATRGGNTISVESEIREMPADGAPGPVLGSQRRVRTVPKLTVNLLEMKTDGLEMNLVGSEHTSNATHDVITRNRQIELGDYFGNVTLVLQKTGTDEVFGFTLKNALSLGNYELAAADDDEAVTVLEFTGHYDPANLADDPWEIFNPLEGGIVYSTITYTAGLNGSIIGDGSQRLALGATGTGVYAAADALYEFEEWSDNSTDNPRYDVAGPVDVDLTASFVLI